MGSLRPNTQIIYESPDGGETIYGRYPGETDRFLVGQSVKLKKKLEEQQQDELWRDIRRAAEKNESLKKALDHCVTIYHLTKSREEIMWHPV